MKMVSKIAKLGCFLVCGCFISASPITSQPSAVHSTPGKGESGTYNTNDFKDKIAAAQAQFDGDPYAALSRLVEVSETLKNSPQCSFEDLLLLRDSSRWGIDKSTSQSQLSVNTKFALLLSFADTHRVNLLSIADTQIYRDADADVLAKCLRRINDSIDSKWDASDLPRINVPLPAGVNGDAGMDPAAIADPVKRAVYEQSIENNRLKAQAYHIQHELRYSQPIVTAALEQLISKAYHNSETDRALISKVLSSAGCDLETVKRVNARISQQPRS